MNCCVFHLSAQVDLEALEARLSPRHSVTEVVVLSDARGDGPSDRGATEHAGSSTPPVAARGAPEARSAADALRLSPPLAAERRLPGPVLGASSRGQGAPARHG